MGTFAVQIAEAFGAEVATVCSTAKADLVRAIGADHVIDSTREDFPEGAVRYDVVIDIGGKSATVPPAARAHRDRTAGHHRRRGRWLGGIDRNLRGTCCPRS